MQCKRRTILATRLTGPDCPQGVLIVAVGCVGTENVSDPEDNLWRRMKTMVSALVPTEKIRKIMSQGLY